MLTIRRAKVSLQLFREINSYSLYGVGQVVELV